MTRERVRELLGQAERMPYGAAKTAVLEQAMAHADAAHLDELSFQARMLCTNAYVYGGEPARSVVTFSWCLAEHDRDPERYRRWHHTLLWHFKYMVLAMFKVPEVSLARTEAVLDEMERRYRETGHGANAVYHYRHLVAEHVGDLAAAQDWFDRWRVTPADPLSDCAGCTPSGQARWLHQVDRDEEAVRLAEPVLAAPPTCSEQPQNLLTTLLVPYLRTGRAERASDAHRRGYLLIRSNLSDLADIGEHARFCARTGNQARALEIVQRHLPWLDRAPSPYATMHFAASAALALRLAGPVTVFRPEHADRPGAELPATELGEALAAEALAVAARFDARNGTDRQSLLVRRILDAEPLAGHLPLSPPGSRHTPPPARPVEPAPPAAAARAGSADELLDLAEAHYAEDRDEEAFATWRAFDARYARVDLTELQRARRADGRGAECAARRDRDAARLAWQAAVDGYARAGDEPRRQQASGRLGMVLCEQGDAGTGLSIVEESTGYLLAHGSPAQRGAAVLRLAGALDFAGAPERALRVLDEIAQREVGPGTPTNLPAKLALHRAHLLGRRGDPAASRTAAEQARSASRACGYRYGLAAANWLVGLAAQQSGDAQAALDAYDEALGVARDGPFRAAIRAQRAGLLAGTPRAAEAVDDLVEAVAQATAEGAGERAAAVQHQLAMAYLNSGRPLDAAEVAEEALAWFARAGDEQAMAVRHLLAGAYRRLDQPHEAVAQLDAIGADCARRGNRAGAGQMSEEAGDILEATDRDALAATRFLAAAGAYHDAGLPVDEVRARRRYTMALLWSGDRDAALSGLAAVDGLAAALPEGERAAWERAVLGYDGARVLADAGQPAAAVDRAGRAAEAFRGIAATAQAAHADLLLADLLLRVARPADAEQSARRALAALPVRTGGWQRAAELVAAALQAQDRAADAAAVRDEYGLAGSA